MQECVLFWQAKAFRDANIVAQCNSYENHPSCLLVILPFRYLIATLFIAHIGVLFYSVCAFVVPIGMYILLPPIHFWIIQKAEGCLWNWDGPFTQLWMDVHGDPFLEWGIAMIKSSVVFVDQVSEVVNRKDYHARYAKCEHTRRSFCRPFRSRGQFTCFEGRWHFNFTMIRSP